jgi:hypothetical protein
MAALMSRASTADILGDNLLWRQPRGEVLEHDQNHDPRARDEGFAAADIWLNRNSVFK